MPLYELREYRAVAGRGEQVAERLLARAIPAFARHGFTVASLWRDTDDPDRLVYVLEWPDREAMRRGWEAFSADPDWRRARAESEARGPILERIERSFLEDLGPVG